MKRNYTVRERCGGHAARVGCYNEARYTTYSSERLCGVCVVEVGRTAIADDRIPELLGILKNALGGGSINIKWLREHIIPIIGMVQIQ